MSQEENVENVNDIELEPKWYVIHTYSGFNLDKSMVSM